MIRYGYKIFALFFAVLPILAFAADSSMPVATPITVGHSVVALNGPWKFHLGDDPHWAEPGFDDSTWENVDLTPKPGAHDADVGLSGYVPGWAARGHAGASGWAWYRIRVVVTGDTAGPLALTGPPAVDNVYQIFFNGKLLGGCGGFSSEPPTIYSIQPRMFTLPEPGSGGYSKPVVIAIRVWMAPVFLRDADAGGIHIAPALGESSGVAARYQLQWLETIRGYIVDVVEPILFLLLVIMVCTLLVFDRSNTGYPWLCAALLITGVARINQATFFWGQFESLQMFVLVRHILVEPLMLAAWFMFWRAWFGLPEPAWLRRSIYAIVTLYFAAQILGNGLFPSFIPSGVMQSAHLLRFCLRLALIILLFWSAYQGIMQRAQDRWVSLIAMALVATGLFAEELSALHIQGIWFPFGTGVSRTQYAYAGFVVIMFVLLLRRLFRFAPEVTAAARS